MISKLRNRNRRSRTMKRIARELDVVYFGDLRHDDDIISLPGLTHRRSRLDRHYMHGNVLGREVSLLLREIKLGRDEEYVPWLVVRVALRSPAPHFALLNRRQQDEWAEMVRLQHGLHDASPHSAALNPAFAAAFVTAADNASGLRLHELVSPYLMEKILVAYPDISVEVLHDSCLLYLPAKHLNTEQAALAVRAALWFTANLERSL